MKTLIAILGILAMAGCTTVGPVEIGSYPTNYKNIIKAHIERSFFDPYSLRNVSITGPLKGPLGWIVCLEANAKNRMGGYTGLQRTSFVINSGKVIDSLTLKPALLCHGMVFTRWPEMERLQ